MSEPVYTLEMQQRVTEITDENDRLRVRVAELEAERAEISRTWHGYRRESFGSSAIGQVLYHRLCELLPEATA